MIFQHGCTVESYFLKIEWRNKKKKQKNKIKNQVIWSKSKTWGLWESD